MNYIISESQSHLLKEHDYQLWIKRRANPVNLKSRITNSIELHSNPCDWRDEYDYAHDVIDWAVEDFLASSEEFYNSENFGDYYTFLVDNCKQWFTEEIISHFRKKCSDEDMEVEI